ncbi:MAG: FKBP-type peptidyl-prolyl cis-trans isomerase [Bacteroidia bacterium]
MKYLSFLMLACMLMTLAACRTAQQQIDYEEELITQYIADKGLQNVQKTESGLRYILDPEGTGTRPDAFSNVEVKYKGTLLDGTVFDENTSGITFNLASVIVGWTEGIPKFKEGGKGTLIIPSRLGYGSTKTGKIPKNSVLVFDIQLIDVK